MRVIAFVEDGVRGLGVMEGETAFVRVEGTSLREVLESPDGIARLRDSARGKPADGRLDAVTLEPLIERPNAIWALALNFKRHIEETGLTTSREFPHLFLRTAASLAGAGEPLVCPPETVARAFDYEGELGVVIGKRGRFLTPGEALEHVAGFTIFNEGSVREYQSHNRNFGLGKNFGRSGSYGPWLMTRDEFGAVGDRTVTTRINGVARQHSRLDDMLFTVEQVVAYLSQGYELEPGDLIAMGTPGALPPVPDPRLPDARWEQFGRLKVPGVVHMRPGDIVEVEIDRLGVLRNPVVAG